MDICTLNHLDYSRFPPHIFANFKSRASNFFFISSKQTKQPPIIIVVDHHHHHRHTGSWPPTNRSTHTAIVLRQYASVTRYPHRRRIHAAIRLHQISSSPSQANDQNRLIMNQTNAPQPSQARYCHLTSYDSRCNGNSFLDSYLCVLFVLLILPILFCNNMTCLFVPKHPYLIF